MKGHNKPPSKSGKRKLVNPEIERLRSLVIKLIQRLAKYEKGAAKYLNELAEPEESGPNDEIEIT